VWDAAAVDAASGITGFARARFADGKFKDTDPRKGFNTDFYEANCWEYSLFVHHDIPGMIARCGGTKAFERRLSYALENNLISFDNEPSFHIPWLFGYVGRSDLVARWTREVASLFSGDDLPGDNDSGAMSSLYVFVKLGFFPMAGRDVFVMHGSAYPRISIELPEGKRFTIIARNLSEGAVVRSVTLNGERHDPFFLRYSEIMAGGELVFEYGTP
jgi:putative alpha-1,2-mannosidase